MNTPVSKVREAKLELYRKKGKIHAREVRGCFNTFRWAMAWLTQMAGGGSVRRGVRIRAAERFGHLAQAPVPRPELRCAGQGDGGQQRAWSRADEPRSGVIRRMPFGRKAPAAFPPAL